MNKQIIKTFIIGFSGILLSATPIIAADIANVEVENYVEIENNVEQKLNISVTALEGNSILVETNSSTDWEQVLKYVIKLDKSQVSNLVSEQCEIVDTDDYIYIVSDTPGNIILTADTVCEGAIDYTGYALKNDNNVVYFNSNQDVIEDGVKIDLAVGLGNMDFEHLDFNNIKTLNQCVILSTQRDEPIDLSKVKIRYYFTMEEIADMNAFCDAFGIKYSDAPWYESISADQVKISATNVKDNKYYLEIGFVEGQVLKKGDIAEMQIRLSRADFNRIVDLGQFDYNDGVAIFYNDKLVDGVEAF